MKEIEINDNPLVEAKAFFLKERLFLFLWYPNTSVMNFPTFCLSAITYILLFGSCEQSSYKHTDDSSSIYFTNNLKKANEKNYTLLERRKYLLKAYNYNNRLELDSLKASRFAKIARVAIKLQDSIMFYRSNKQALVLSQKINSIYSIADTKWNLAEFHLARHIYDSAFMEYQNANLLFKQIPHPYYSAKMLYNMAYIKSLITDYTGAEILLFQALETFLELEKKKQTFQAYNLLGSIYDDLEEYNHSLEYYNKALEYLPSLKNEIGNKEDILNNIGVVYQKMGKQGAAINTFEAALENEILIQQKPELYARLLDNRAYSLFLGNEEGDVLGDFKTALIIRDSLNNIPSVIMSHLHLADYFLLKEHYSRALQHADLAYTMSSGKELNRDKLNSLKLMAKIDTLAASHYLTKYIILSDSLEHKEKKQRDKFARIHFETDKYIIANKKLSREKLLLAAIVIAIFVLLVLLFIVMYQRGKNKELKFEAEQQKADEAIYSLRIDQMRQGEKVRQEERERISEDLHDSILGQLYGIRMNWEFQDLIDEEGSTITKQQQLNNLLKVEKEVRNLSHNLSATSTHDAAHLIENLKLLLKEKSKLGNFKYQFKDSASIDWEKVNEFTKVNLYRIIEESLHNIVKHSQATKAKLIITGNGEELQILISDNGIGFVDKVNKRGVGLRNMESRAKKIGVILTMGSGDQGTTIIIKLKDHGRA